MPNHVTLIKHFKNSKNISSMRYNTFTIKTNEKEKKHTHTKIWNGRKHIKSIVSITNLINNSKTSIIWQIDLIYTYII